MTRRSQMEMFLDLLKAVAEGRQKPTHIMYRANLSWIRLNKHLDFLVRQELLAETHESGAFTYRITQKGIEVLEYLKKIEGELYNKRAPALTKVYVRRQ